MMLYAQVQNGQVVQIGLPDTGAIDGRTVSNYNLLPADTLAAQGWQPCTEVKPVYDPDAQQLVIDSATVNGDSVTVTYKAITTGA